MRTTRSRSTPGGNTSDDDDAPTPETFMFNGVSYHSYNEMVEAKRQRNRDLLASSGVLEAKSAIVSAVLENGKKAAKAASRASVTTEQPVRTQLHREAKKGKKKYTDGDNEATATEDGDEFVDEDDEEDSKVSSPEAKSAKRKKEGVKSAKGDVDDDEEESKPKKNKVFQHKKKDEIKKQADRIHRLGGVDQWIQELREKEESADADELELPPSLAEQTFKGRLIVKMTKDEIRNLSEEDIDKLSDKRVRAFLKKLGSINSGSTKQLKQLLKGIIVDKKAIIKGFSNKNRSKYCVETGLFQSERKDEEPQPLLHDLLGLAKDDRFTFIRIEHGVLRIEETPDSQEKSNLAWVSEAIGCKSIPRFMVRILQLKFVVGPKDHGYYKSERVRPAKYERDAMDLYHPDIGADFEPGKHQCSLTKLD